MKCFPLSLCVTRRVTQAGDLVPVAPLECCGVCLGDTIHTASDCRDLSYCHDHGMCMLGGCQCFHGWGGADCSQVRAGEGGGGGRGCSWKLERRGVEQGVQGGREGGQGGSRLLTGEGGDGGGGEGREAGGGGSWKLERRGVEQGVQGGREGGQGGSRLLTGEGGDGGGGGRRAGGEGGEGG